MRWVPFLLLSAAALAQNPPLTPTSNTVLDTTATQGVFAFSRIAIPQGVRVTFSGTYPVQIRCDGDAAVDGQLDVDATGATGGPGAEAALGPGMGAPGVSVSGYPAFLCPPASVPTSGRHAGIYGSAMPFDLRGGSPGGWVNAYYGPNSIECWQVGLYNGGGGGGTIVLDAMGRIDVRGRISANGDVGPAWSTGSGGSVMLRGARGLTVHATGMVLAGGEAPGQWAGIIRLDAYAQPPVVLGTVQPPPFPLELPNLTETRPPLLGNTWELRIAAPRGDGVFLAASLQPGTWSGPYGTLGFLPGSASTIAYLLMPTTGHDPLACYQLTVPPDPIFVGLNIWTAGLDWFTVLPPRVTNTVPSVVR